MNAIAKVAAFNAEYPYAVAALAWAENCGHRIARDLWNNLHKWGKLTPKQAELLVKLHTQELEKPPVTGTLPDGKATITGTIAKTRVDFGPYGEVRKVLLALEGNVKVWGNAPAAANPVQGQVVRFTATFEPSPNDKGFGFWKRPKDWTTVQEAEPAAQ
jgi:hypothetical protein